jgi:hypothetical protein
MRKFWILALIFSSLALLIQPAVALPSDPAPTRIMAHPDIVTKEDSHSLVTMQVGERFALKLGEAPPEWAVTVADQTVIQRVTNILTARGVQGIYEAKRPGKTVLSATGAYPCHPSCKIAIPYFEVTILVQPARTSKAVFTVGQTTYQANGETGYMDVPAYVENGRTYVPIRFLSTALGASASDISWDPNTKEVKVILDGMPIRVQVGSQRLDVGDTAITMDTATSLKQDRAVVPIRWIAEALGYRVIWNPDARSVTIQP